MSRLGCLTLLFACFLACVLPLLFVEAFTSALGKLGMPPDLALLFFIAMLAGGAINIPVWRRQTSRFVRRDPLAVVGLEGILPHWGELRRETVIAVNVGGCLIPSGIALYQVAKLATGEAAVRSMIALAIAVAVNVAVCWKLARPVAGVGIALPGFVPPLVAAASALVLQADHAPSVAFVAGVAGPLIGADLLHLRDLKASPVALASIGGAGTFDGIVLSVVIAAILA